MSVLAEFDQIQKIKVAKEKENMQRIEITVKSNNQEAVSISSEKIKVIIIMQVGEVEAGVFCRTHSMIPLS